MLNNGQTSKYLKYATGEIVLVVIGILIALSINNWNENIKRQSLEKVLLAEIKEELVMIKYDLDYDLILLNLAAESYVRVLDCIKNNENYVDSMCFDFYFLKNDEYIKSNSAAFEKVKDAGLDIIKNDSIKIYLKSLYESNFPRISKDHPFWPDIDMFFSDYYQRHFTPNIDFSLKFIRIFPPDTICFPSIDNTVDSRLATVGYVPLDFDALKKDHQFKMLLDLTYNYRRQKIRKYKAVQGKLDLTISLIEKELANG